MSDDSVRERLARMESKQDFLVNEFLDWRREQKESCSSHAKLVADMQGRVSDLEHLRWYCRGIVAVMALGFAYFREEIKARMRVP